MTYRMPNRMKGAPVMHFRIIRMNGLTRARSATTPQPHIMRARFPCARSCVHAHMYHGRAFHASRHAHMHHGRSLRARAQFPPIIFTEKERVVDNQVNPLQFEDHAVADARVALEQSAIVRAARRLLQDYLLAGRAIGMTRARALQYALADVKRICGVDWVERLNIDVGIDTLPAEFEPTADSDIALFLRQWRDDDLGLPYQPTLSTVVFARYRAWCVENGVRALNTSRFVNGVKRQWGRSCNPRRRWTDAAGEHGPNGFIDPPDVAIRDAVRGRVGLN